MDIAAEVEVKTEGKTMTGPLSLLPIEMWVQTLERLDKSRDVRSFCKAWKYPDFDAALHCTKPSWLFDEVFPLIFNYLPKKEQILACRLVCKKWCKAVDCFLESNPCHRPSNTENYCHSAEDIRLGTLAKSLRTRGLLHATLSPEKIVKILQSSNGTGCGNPIISRSPRFDWSKDVAPITSFLSKFGNHIWDFRIEIREDSPVKFFKTLQKYLKLLPNLKRLEIFGETMLVIEHQVDANLKELEQFDLTLFELPHLETLHLTVYDQYQDKITEILLNQYAPTLRSLTIHRYTLPVEISQKLKNLCELTISADSDNQLETLSGLNLPLQHLVVFIVRNSHRGSYPDFVKTFNVINSFANTLQTLCVEFPVTYSPIQWSNQANLPTLQLPQLKSLELKEATFHSFNFISELKSLELLYLTKYRWGQRVGLTHHYGDTYDDRQTPPEPELVDLKGLLDDPATNSRSDRFYQSNLWSVLPRLKILTISKAGNLAASVNEQRYRRV